MVNRSAMRLLLLFPFDCRVTLKLNRLMPARVYFLRVPGKLMKPPLLLPLLLSLLRAVCRNAETQASGAKRQNVSNGQPYSVMAAAHHACV
jgi:hypothetical protein